jgi:type IV secretion system protein TrbJ
MKTMNISKMSANLSVNLSKRSLVSKAAAAVLATSLSVWGVPAHAAWWSTEWTQIANNAELGGALGEQMELVRVQALEYQTQLKEYQIMLENMKKLANTPKNLIDQATSPVRVAIDSVTKLKDSVTSLQQASKEVGTSWQRSVADITALKLKPEVYFEQQRQLADKRGGIYKQQWDKDIASMKELQDNIANVKSLANSIPGINGNIQGLQLLNTQMNQMLQATTETQALMTRKSANDLQDRMDKEQANVLLAERKKQQLAATKARETRDVNIKSTFKAPWEQ